MIIRALDGDHDFTYGKGTQSYLTSQQAIAENIQTRLLSFVNDCYFDLTAGIDWVRLLGSKDTKEEIILSTRAIILNSYGVVKVNTLSINLDRGIRNLNLTYNIDTIFTSQFTQSLEVFNA